MCTLCYVMDWPALPILSVTEVTYDANGIPCYVYTVILTSLVLLSTSITRVCMYVSSDPWLYGVYCLLHSCVCLCVFVCK